jgi:hypothetical protein
MIADKHCHAWKVEASGTKGGIGRLGHKCHGLSHSVVISDQAVLALIIRGVESMEGMELVRTSCGRRSAGDGQGD